MNVLGEAEFESIERIAWHCARHSRGSTPRLTLEERYEAALNGIVERVHAEGRWPDKVQMLFTAGSDAIWRENHERGKNLHHAAYWLGTHGEPDEIAEQITDRIAVHEITWLFSREQWEAVWALAEVQKRDGSIREAAALLGISDSALVNRLLYARQKARAAWVAPGETPRGMYRPARDGVKTRWQAWKIRQPRLDQRRQQRMDAEAA